MMLQAGDDFGGIFGIILGCSGNFTAPFFLCPKWSIFGSGLAGGLANWTCIFQKLDLQKWVKQHTDS